MISDKQPFNQMTHSDDTGTHTHNLRSHWVPPNVQNMESCKATTEFFAWTVCMATLQAVAYVGHATSPAQPWVGEWVLWWFLE